MTNFGKKMLSFFAVFFLTLCMIGCQMSNEVGDRTESKEAKENVQWLLSNFNFGEVINNNVKDPVIGNVGIAEDLDGQISENDLRNGSYSEFMYGMSASFESSNPEVMNAEWVTYKKRAYVYGDPANPDKITGIETQETTVLEFVVNRPAADQEDVQVDITIKVKAPYQVGEQTYYHEGTRTLTFTVLKKAESNTMTVGELEDYIIANWASFTNGSLFKDENGNDLNVSIEGVVTEQVWGDGYTSHSFTMADDNGNGIYVYGPQSPVNIGDRVIVTGKPATYNGTIQIGLDSTVEVISEASEYVPAEETTLEEWYAKYPTQATDHKVPGKRIKVSGLFIQKTVDGYTNYAIQSTESDHFIQIYYKSYGAYEEELLKEMLGKAAEFEIAMYYCHNNGYWVGILNNYDYKPELIEMTAEDKLAADVAGIKVSQTVKNGEKVDLPTGALANGTVLSGWTADKEGYINLETLEANLGATKEDVKVTLTATATNGEASQEVKVEVTIKYVKGEIAEKTVKELIELTEEMLETFKVTGTVVQWGNKIGTPDEAPTMYGNFILQGEDGSQIVVYGSTASESALVWDSATGKYKYTNAKDFLTNELTSQIKLGDKVELLVVRTSYNGNPQLNAVVLGIKNDKVEVTHHVLGVYQASLGKTLYVTGNVTNERYLETTEDITLAAKVYIEEVEGGSRFYILEGETKKYLDTYMNSANKISLRFDAASECVYAYDEATKAWVTNVDGTDYYFGTYSTFETLSASKTSYITAENTGVSQFPGFLEKAEAGETPEPPVHEHNFVEGKCACGEVDPNYVAPEVPANEIVFDFTTGSTGIGSAYNTAAAEITMNGITFGYLQMKSSGYDGNNFVMFCKSTDAHIYNKTAFAGSIVKIEVFIPSGASATAQYFLSLHTEAAAGNITSTVSYKGAGGSFVIEATEADGFKYFNLSSDSTTTKNGQLAKIVVTLAGGQTPEPPVHEHEFVEGKCACGEVDPNYVAPEVPTTEVVKEGVAYLLGVNQVSVGKTIYVTGEVTTRYLVTTTDTALAAKVYAEKAEGGYKFYILDGETKKYLDTYFNSDSKISLQFSADSTCVYTYNADTKAWATNVNGTNYYFGTYSTFETLSASNTSYINSQNTGVSQFPGFFVEAPEVETPEPPVHEHEFVEGKCACGEEDPNYVAPEVQTANKADFDTMGAKSSSYLDRTSEAGWTATFAALNCGGTSDSNPQFIVFGDVTNFAVTLAGGTDKVGTLTSPLLNNGLAKLTFNYTKLFTDTTLSITVYVKDAEGNVLYSEVVTYAAEKNEKYVVKTYELVLDTPIEGDFVIQIVNNCPMGLTGNKDRISIWNLTWENAPVHEHDFVEGKCECGEEDPNYVAPEVTKTATLAYTAGTTTNMKANTNNAATVGLDAELFTVTSLNNGNNNHVGLNKDGTTRLYANKTDGNGNTLVIESEKTIKSIEITFGSTVGAFTVNGQEGSKTVAVYEINGNKVEIQNVQTGATTQVHIKTIVITYVE